MTQTTFQVQKRTEEKPKKLRRTGVVPGNIFGGKKSLAIQMGDQDFRRLYEEVGETGLVYIQVDDAKEQHPVLVEEVQTNPVDGSLFHVSFKKVDLTEKVEAQVPVETIGVFDVPQGVLMVVKDEIEVEALPADLPEKFEIDVSTLKEVGQMIAYKDLNYDRSKVTLILGEEGEEEPVVLVDRQREEEPEEQPVVEAAEGEAAPADGETPAAPGAEKADAEKSPEKAE
jgi:large subunit ribosomal protein L25